jgi:hypothetical protein
MHGQPLFVAISREVWYYLCSNVDICALTAMWGAEAWRKGHYDYRFEVEL